MSSPGERYSDELEKKIQELEEMQQSDQLQGPDVRKTKEKAAFPPSVPQRRLCGLEERVGTSREWFFDIQVGLMHTVYVLFYCTNQHIMAWRGCYIQCTRRGLILDYVLASACI